MLLLFFKLLIGHALSDFVLRTEAMSKEKCRHYRYLPPGRKMVSVWFYYLTAHALINCGVVWLITGSVTLAVCELILHWFIDLWKCEGWFDPHVDQLLHVLCKAVYTLLWAGGL